MAISDRVMSNHSTAPAEAPPPVFLLSCERSGSTLLRYMLDTHPEVCSPGELNLAQLAESLCRVLDRSTGRARFGEDASRRRTWVCLEARRIVDEIMGEYVEARGARVWCDKAPGNLRHLRSLELVFPESRQICLYRHAMDVVHSCLEVSQLGFMEELAPFVAAHPQNLVEAMIESWIAKTGKLLALEERRPDTTFRVHFEDLVSDTERVLAPLLQFVGVSPDPTLPSRIFTTPHDQGGGDSKIRRSSRVEPGVIGKGWRIPQARIPESARQRMNELLGALDYPLVTGDWDAQEPPVATRRHAPSVPAELLAMLPGDYLVQGARVGVVATPEGGLAVCGPDQDATRLVHAGGWHFTLEGAPGFSIRFVRHDSPSPPSIVVEQPDGVATGRRLAE